MVPATQVDEPTFPVPDLHPIRDTNGHQWPLYFYFSGSTIDITGMTQVVAVPVAESRVRHEIPDWHFTLGRVWFKPLP